MEALILIFLVVLLILLLVLISRVDALAKQLREIRPATPEKPEKPVVSPPPPPSAHFPPPPPPPSKPVSASPPSAHFPPPPPPRAASGAGTPVGGFWRWFCYGNRREGESAEYAAATTWLMRAGILILLCGVGFFLKYSIENGLVSPPVRVTLAYLAGLAMFGAGLSGVNRRFHVLAVGILAAGVVTLYMGSYAGYRLYKIVPLEAAFALMALTAAAGMLVAVRLKLLPVALAGCVGAYLVPVLLSQKTGNLPVFLGYIALVSCGVLIAARAHRWRSVEILAFLLSFCLIGSASDKLSEHIDGWCLAFLLVNFLVFSLIPAIRRKTFAFGLHEWLLPVAAAGLTLFQGSMMLDTLCPPSDDMNLAAAALALFVSAVTLGEGAALVRLRPDCGGKILPAFVAASMVALALAVPLAHQSAASMTTGWAALGFALTFAYARSRMRTLLVCGMPVFFAACLTALHGPVAPDMAERFFLHGACAFALLGAGAVLRKTGDREWAMPFGTLYAILGGLFFLYWSSVEVHRGLKACETLAGFRNGGVTVWWAVLAVSMLGFGISRRVKALRIAALCLFAACAFKIVSVDLAMLDTLQKAIAFLLAAVLYLGGAAVYIFRRKLFSGDKA